MKLAVWSLACVLPLLMTACFHRAPTPAPVQQATAPPIVETPAPQPQPAATTPQTQPAPKPDSSAQPGSTTATSAPPQQPAPKPPVHRHKPVNHNPQQAAVASPGVSAIGQLSTGDPADYRWQTVQTINGTERGLNGINRPLNDSEQRTAAHIREFLKQARTALASGDVDGAHNLAAKAKVLLAELTR